MRSIVFGLNSIFHPLGPEPDNSTSSAGAVPVLVTRIATVVSWPAVARALSNPSRPEISSFWLTRDVEAEDRRHGGRPPRWPWR